MKIKNKFALLIIISLFLLISIGSVCASDNTIAEQAVPTDDENSDGLTIENEIKDDNIILSTDDNTLLKENSSDSVKPAQTSADVNSSKIVEVKLNASGDINVNDLKPTVTYTDGNTTKTIATSDYKLDNLTYSFKLGNADFKTASLALTYKGNSIGNITLNRIYNVDVQTVNDLTEYRTGYYTFRVVDRDDKNKALTNVEVSLTTMGNIKAGFSAKTDANGIASFDANTLYEFSQESTLSMKYLSTGYHNVTIGTKDIYKSTDRIVRLGVTKGNVKITVSPYNEPYGSEKNATITATKSDGKPLTNEVIYISMPQTTNKNYYFSTDSNGQCKLNLKNLIPGTYDYKVAANNTASIKLQPVTGKFTVQKVRVEFSIATPSVYYNTETTATITVKNQKTGKLVSGAIIKATVYETTNSYKVYRFQTNENGSVAFSTSLSVGRHKILVSIAESNYEPRYVAYDKTGFVKICFATAKVVAPKGTATYKDGSKFNVKIVNVKRDDKGIYDTKVNIKIYVSSSNYYSYTASTDANGIIKIPLESFTPGTYKVEISNGDANNLAYSPLTTQFVIKNAPTKIIPANVTAKEGQKKFFTAKVINTKTNKVIPGLKVTLKIYTGNSYQTYTASTNSSGYLNFNVNGLSVGTHKVLLSPAVNYFDAETETAYITITKWDFKREINFSYSFSFLYLA